MQINIVPTNKKYNYNILMKNIEELKNKYKFLKVGTIGYSVLGKQIKYIKIGNGKKEVLYHGGTHANEWITSVLLMKFVENFCKSYENNEEIYSYSSRKIFEENAIYIVPMINPDGIDLVTRNIKKDTEIYKNYLNIAKEFKNIPFPNGWKANFNGVDLNLQFPAGWDKAKQIKFAQGYNKPSPRDFVGEGPLTEPEALAIYKFTLKHNFRLILAYHTQGEVIYWKYQSYLPKESKNIGMKFANVSGYTLENTPSESANAGYKDWFIEKYNRPGYTIEAGIGENPLPISQFNEIYNTNIGILVLGVIL